MVPSRGIRLQRYSVSAYPNLCIITRDPWQSAANQRRGPSSQRLAIDFSNFTTALTSIGLEHLVSENRPSISSICSFVQDSLKFFAGS